MAATLPTKQQSRLLPKNVRAIEATKPTTSRTSYSIRGERGLRLIIHPTGRKVWFALYQLGSGASRTRRWHEIGTFPEIGLSDACKEASRIRVDVENGIDPEDAKTFDDLFQAWLTEHAKKKLVTWQDEEARYCRHLESAVGSKAYDKIERKVVRKIRDHVHDGSGPIESNRVVALFNRVMNWAVDEDRAKFNPASRLKKIGEERRRERVLTDEELERLWIELDKRFVVDNEKGGLTHSDFAAAIAVRHAIKLLIVTGQRRGEVIGMLKSELDLTVGKASWTIPGKRTKNSLTHRVPLTMTAVEILQQALDASNSDTFVFPSPKNDGAIRPDAVTKQLQRICKKMQPRIEGVGPHDFRRTCGTTMRKLGISVEDRGHVFNHVSGAKAKVTSWNYDAGEHDDEKRRALEAWERELGRVIGGKGIPKESR